MKYCQIKHSRFFCAARQKNNLKLETHIGGGWNIGLHPSFEGTACDSKVGSVARAQSLTSRPGASSPRSFGVRCWVTRPSVVIHVFFSAPPHRPAVIRASRPSWALLLTGRVPTFVSSAASSWQSLADVPGSSHLQAAGNSVGCKHSGIRSIQWEELTDVLQSHDFIWSTRPKSQGDVCCFPPLKLCCSARNHEHTLSQTHTQSSSLAALQRCC